MFGHGSVISRPMETKSKHTMCAVRYCGVPASFAAFLSALTNWPNQQQFTGRDELNKVAKGAF